MNTFETLPKSLEYDGDIYFLGVHITAWDKYCIRYKGMEKDPKTGERNTILSCVVEGRRRKAENIDDIADAVDFDDAVEITKSRIEKHFKVVEKYVKK
jgi:hypothetical protein